VTNTPRNCSPDDTMGRSADVRHLFGQGMHTKGLICMEDIIAILEELVPDVDVKTCTTLVDGRYLDSLAIVALIAELEDALRHHHPGQSRSSRTPSTPQRTSWSS